MTVSGAPYYQKGQGDRAVFIYWDPDCDDNPSTNSPPHWVFDGLRPSIQKAIDLDDDGQCRHSADNFDDWESQTIIVNSISGTQSWSAACNDTGIPQLMDVTIETISKDDDENDHFEIIMICIFVGVLLLCVVAFFLYRFMKKGDLNADVLLEKKREPRTSIVRRSA